SPLTAPPLPPVAVLLVNVTLATVVVPALTKIAAPAPMPPPPAAAPEPPLPPLARPLAMARFSIVTLPPSTTDTRLLPPPLMVRPELPAPLMVTLALIVGSGPLVTVMVELAGTAKLMVEPGLALAKAMASRNEPQAVQSLVVVTTCACAASIGPTPRQVPASSRAIRRA